MSFFTVLKEGASARKTQTPAAQPVPRPGKNKIFPQMIIKVTMRSRTWNFTSHTSNVILQNIYLTVE